MSYWKDKVVLITGGSAGLGLAIGQAFLVHGATVILVGRNEQRLQDAVSQLIASERGNVEGRKCDVTDTNDVSSLVSHVIAKHGRLDVLVNNAGKSARGRVLDTPIEAFRELLELNFLAAVRCTQAFAKTLTANRGHVVNIGSLSAKIAAPYLGAYAASKFPVAAFSQQLRLETKPNGLHVLLVCPGPIQRADAGQRYQGQLHDLPDSARRPGGGVQIKGIPPEQLARKILRACESRVPELVVPGKVRLLVAISQLFPKLGDWIVSKKTGN